MIHIITDSTSDITQESAKQLGISIAPLTVNFGDVCYTDGIDISTEEFYEKLQNTKELPSTSQVNPAEFITLFQKQLEAGNEVVGIFIGSDLSGTYQSAVIAKKMLDSDRIHLIDSKNTTFALRLLVHVAVNMSKEGKSGAEIKEALDVLKEKVVLYAFVPTLKYLHKGGRLSTTQAALGTLLNVNPIIQVLDGKVISATKVRGKSKAFSWFKNTLTEEPIDDNYPVFMASTMAVKDQEELRQLLQSEFSTAQFVDVGLIGITVGTHAGPGCVGFAYIKK